MTRSERITAFQKLGDYIRSLNQADLSVLAESARLENPWFTSDNVILSLKGISKFLKKDTLSTWTNRYPFSKSHKMVAIVMAGNIPLVGFHDLLSVLISGHSAQIKMSSKDSKLTNHLLDTLKSIEPAFAKRIQIVERLENFDAVIATGSDNSARYFDYYFGKYPNIIRKNRTSCAVLTGSESREDLLQLGKDVFSYFGLGCRNVSKLFVPSGYVFDTLFESWQPFQEIINHHKYCNNYDYQKSIMLVNRIPFLDNEFVMLTESEKLVSPISVLFYEYYESTEKLNDQFNKNASKIQCIVGRDYLPFGTAQTPEVWDYADQVDTLKFLTSL